MRRAAKIDANHREIVEVLRNHGAYVQTFGPVDILVGWKGKWYLMEIKDGAKPHSARALTKKEIFFMLDCKNRAPVHLVTSPKEALAVLREDEEDETGHV